MERRNAACAPRLRASMTQYVRTLVHLGLTVLKPARPRLGVLHQHSPRPLVRPDPWPYPQGLEAPRISLVTPSFEQAVFIGRTLDSVLAQDYPDLDYRVQDGGSTDGTLNILRTYADRLGSWQSAPDRGQADAINRAFSRSDGEIMGWLNSDDMLMPGALARVAEFMTRHPEVDVVYGHRILVDEHDREIGRWILPAHDDEVLRYADFIPQETLFWRRSLWLRCGGQVDESFQFALDWDLLLRFRDAGARMVRLPHFLGAFRVHAAQKTSAAIASTGRSEMDRLRLREHGHVLSDEDIFWKVMPYLLRHVRQDMAYRVFGRL